MFIHKIKKAILFLYILWIYKFNLILYICKCTCQNSSSLWRNNLKYLSQHAYIYKFNYKIIIAYVRKEKKKIFKYLNTRKNN